MPIIELIISYHIVSMAVNDSLNVCIYFVNDLKQKEIAKLKIRVKDIKMNSIDSLNA